MADSVLSRLSDFDVSAGGQAGTGCVIGVDEAGRGPLAGPVVACAVYIPQESISGLSGVNDSKVLSASARERLFCLMRAKNIPFAAGYSLPREIDRINILQATFKAMSDAVARLVAVLQKSEVKSQKLKFISPHILVDGPHRIPGVTMRQTAVVGGDAKSLSIACASICAKVIRDRWMDVLDKKYPDYGFGKHKGYGTKMHMEMLAGRGVCPEHRMTFAPVASCAAAPGLPE